MINVGDWIGQATTTTGDGPITLGAQLQGYTSFADHNPDSQFWYAILDGYNREVGIGSFVGPDQFTRDTIHATLIEGVYRGLSGGPVAIPLSGEAVIFSTFNEQAFDQLFAHLEDTDIHFSDAPVDGTPYSRQDKAWVPASSGGGEANTSSNVGTGEGLAKPKVDIDLPFKSLIGGTNVTLDSTDNEVTINASTDHDDLTNVTPDQHHNQAHLLYGPDQTDVDSSGTPSLRDGLFFNGNPVYTDIWTDPPTSIGAAWSELGGGVYSAAGIGANNIGMNGASVNGTTYRVRFTINSATGSGFVVRVGTSNYGGFQNAVGEHVVDAEASVDGLIVGIRCNSDEDGSISNVSIEDLSTGVVVGDFALDRRMNWRSSWAAGTYEKEDVVRDGNWLAIANTQTTERPAPQATGEPYEPASGVVTWDTGQQTDSVTVGNIYTANQGFYSDAIGLSVAPDNVGLTHTYVVIVDDILKGTLTWMPEASGPVVLNMSGVIIPAGSVVEVRVTVVNDTGNNRVYWQEDVGYWGTYVLPDELADVQGIKDGGAPSDTAYAVDIRITPASISTDWDILAVSGGSSGGGGGGSFTPEIFNGAGTQGYVPDPGTEQDAFLRDDGLWATPSGGGDVIGPSGAVPNNFPSFNGGSGKIIMDSGYNQNSFATSSQGGKADSALQPGDVPIFAGAGDDGLVPAPAAESGLFLRDDGEWAAGGTGGPDPVQNKGDIYTHNGIDDAALPLGVGQGNILTVNNAADTGMEWQALPLPPQGYMSLNYDWNQATTSPPSAGEIRVNTPDVVDATKVYIDNTTSNGNDVHDFVNALQEGEFLILWEQVSNHQTCIYQVQGVTDHTDWLEIDVSYVYSSPFTEYGTGYNMSVALVAAPGQLLPDGGTTGQTLVKASDNSFDTEWGAASGGVGFDPLWYRVPGDGILVFGSGQSNCDLNLPTGFPQDEPLIPINEPFVLNPRVFELVNTSDPFQSGVATAEWVVADLDKPDNGLGTASTPGLGLSGDRRGNTSWALCNRLSELYPDENIYLVQTYRVGSKILHWEPNVGDMSAMNIAAMDRALELLPDRVNRFADIFDWRQGAGDSIDGGNTPAGWEYYRDAWLAIVDDYQTRGYLKEFYSTNFYTEVAQGTSTMRDFEGHSYIDEVTNQHTRIISSVGYDIYDGLHFDGDSRMMLGRVIANTFMQAPSAQTYIPSSTSTGGGLDAVEDDPAPVLGGDLDGNGNRIHNTSVLELSGLGTYTGPQDDAPAFIDITQDQTYNFDADNMALPSAFNFGGTHTLERSGFFLGVAALFQNSANFVFNAGGNAGSVRTLQAQPTMTAPDGKTVNLFAQQDILVAPYFVAEGTGNLIVSSYEQVAIGSANVTGIVDIGLRLGIGIAAQNKSNTGTLDKDIGINIQALVNASDVHCSLGFGGEAGDIPNGNWGLYQQDVVINSLNNLTLQNSAGYDQPRGLVTGTDGSLSANDLVQLNSGGELWLGAGVWPEAVPPENRSLGLHLFPWGAGTVVLMASQRDSSGFVADKALWAYGSQVSIVAAEEDLILGAGAASVRLQYNGTNGLSLNAAGAVVVHNLIGTGTRNVSVQANGQLIAGAAALSEVGTQWVEQVAEHFDENTVSTTDNQWTTIGTLTLASGEVKRGNFSVKAVRTDAKGKYISEQPFIADHDGTLDVDTGDIEEVGAALLNARVQANGNDVEFQVRGRNGQSWDWTGVAFNRDF